MQRWEPGATFANPAGQVRFGHADLREELGPLADAQADFQVTIKKIVQTEDLALIHSEWRITRPRQVSGYALEVLRQ